MTSISQFLAVFLARVHEMGVAEAGAFYGTISGIALAIGPPGRQFRHRPAVAPRPALARLGRRDRARRRALPLLGGILGGEPPRRFDPAGAGRVDFAAVLRPDHGHDPEPAAAEDARHRRGALRDDLHDDRRRARPVWVGFASDRLAARAFAGDYVAACPAGLPPPGANAAAARACADASASGVQQALMVSVSVFFVSALLFLLASRTLREDLYDPGGVEPQTRA
jgi:hypothetical protein